MGLLGVLTLTLEAAVLAWYALVPLVGGAFSLLHKDLRQPLRFRQSLAGLALLALLRLSLVAHIRHRNKRAPATRCFVFVVSLVVATIGALGSLQPLLFFEGHRSFMRWRGLRWGGIYVGGLWALWLTSTLLQFTYILQLNRSRGHLADDKLMREVISEQADEEDAKRARWRSKWAQLGQQLAGRRKQRDPTFEAIVRLYAHQDGAVKRLHLAYDRTPAEFEFYLPQLCSFLLLGGFPRSPQLSQMLLDKCSTSHVFAHKMLWYLQSYCLWNPAFATQEDIRRVQLLLEDVSERGTAPMLTVDCPPSPAASEHADPSATNPEARTARVAAAISAPNSSQELESLLPTANTKDEHYSTFLDQSGKDDLERGLAGTAVGIPSVHGVEPFELETIFLGALANVSSNLRSVAYDRRNEMLRKWLGDLVEQYLPSNSLYLPVSNSYHRLKHIHVSESFTFSTRERVPYLLCAEVVDYPSPQEIQAQNKRRRSSVFNRRFTLGLWDTTSAQELASATAASERTPLVSPDAATLGFWSESRTPSSPRLRSFSHHFSNSIAQPTGELLHGLLDTLVGKAPGGKTDSKDEALLTGQGNGGVRQDENERPTLFLDRPARSQSQPFLKSPELTRFSRSVDSSVEALRTTLATVPPSQTEEQPALPTAEVEAVDVDTPPSGVWSPKSDTALSESSASSPHPIARFDSTDRFLQDLSERDSKLEEDDESDSSAQSSEGRRIAAAAGDPPCVIFKERWAEKERRIQATSPCGHLPGWRLLPVIVKSDDDLRQEQLASQLIRQFAKVFEEFKVPVYIRPYDVIAISATSGLVEAISDTISLDSLKRNDREYTTLLDFFTRHFGDPSTAEFRQARANFVSSMAAYSIVSYLLQIKDRHNGNLLLDAEGHLIHIDFGFILSNNPGNVAFEQAPFKLTADFVELMGGPRSAHFRRFRSLCVRAFLVARKYRHRFVLLVEMMLHGNEHLPCFAGDPKGTVEALAARFQPDLDINSCEDFVHELIDASLDNWRTRWYDKYQRWIVGVF